MCNHYQNIPGAEKFLPTWREFIGLDVQLELPAYANDMWPKRQGLVLRVEEGSLKADAMMWGVPCVVPGKRPGSKITKHVTNVRNLTSPFWWWMLIDPARRCLVPFTSFAEPVIGGGRAEHWFTIKDRPLTAFAGIWRPTEEGNAFAFLTCEPNPLVAPLHPKAMPVILPEADYRAWLTGDWEQTQALACPYPSQLMEVESPSDR
jgi:putative SOS response-associated peptidase YedK